MKIKKIVIVGGGTAGWMSASTLLHHFPDKEIVLVESPNTPSIGVGESTVAGGQSGFNGITDWLRSMDIVDSDWMSHCDAIHKLSIAFKDWYRKDSGTFHFPFGEPVDGDPRLWYLKKIFYPDTPSTDFAETFYPGMACVNQNKSLHCDRESSLVRSTAGWSYQFDATKFANWLRDHYCIDKYSDRFLHIQAEVLGIPDNEDGIKYLILDNGLKQNGDLFIDCTGFKSLLLSGTFGVDFVSLEDFIPNNYAWATKIPYRDPESQIVNYTNCTAIDNGWVWEIPLWSRMGAGYVFSDKFVTKGHALCEFKAELQKKGYGDVEELDYHLIPMKCGIQSKLWVKNTCAIGLSAGFIEPLQSNGLQSIYQFLFTLVRTLGRDHISEWDRREFTAKCQSDFYAQAHIVALSYVLSHRDDTEYWRDIQNRDYPEDIFSGGPDISKHFSTAFMERNWRFSHTGSRLNCMSTGMNWNPIYSVDASIWNSDQEEIENFKQKTEERTRNWNEEVKDFPSPYQYLKENIHNDRIDGEGQ